MNTKRQAQKELQGAHISAVHCMGDDGMPIPIEQGYGNDEFENALAEILHETHSRAGSLWIDMLSQACQGKVCPVGRNNTGRCTARASASSSGFLRARRGTSRSGQVLSVNCLVRICTY